MIQNQISQSVAIYTLYFYGNTKKLELVMSFCTDRVRKLWRMLLHVAVNLKWNALLVK